MHGDAAYAFLDSGCTDTLIDRGVVEHLGIQGMLKQVGINTITNSGKFLEYSQVSFTLSSLERFGQSIEVSEAYVLFDLNQSQRALPEQVDVYNHPHLCNILLGNISHAHIQKEARIAEDARKGLYGCRYHLVSP